MRRVRRLLPDRCAGLHRGRRHSAARLRRRPRRRRHGTALRRKGVRRYGRGHPALRPGHRLLLCGGLRPPSVPPLPLQPLAGAQPAIASASTSPCGVLPDNPPTLEELGIEPEIVAAWDLCRGLTLVTGVPGSGKSTLLAAGTQAAPQERRGAGAVLRGPDRVRLRRHRRRRRIDVVVGGAAPLPELRRRAAGPACRRRPAAVIVGEARDRETVEAVIRAADFGIAVFATAHTIGVAAAIRRLLAEFPADERHERGAALIDVMTLVVTQMLLPNPAGGRTAIREWLRLRRCPQGERCWRRRRNAGRG